MSAPVESFIARWQHADGTELANAQTFVRELCELLGVPVPDPARADTADNAYVFERRIVFRLDSGSPSKSSRPTSKAKGPWKKRLPQPLDTLVALDKAGVLEDGRWIE